MILVHQTNYLNFFEIFHSKSGKTKIYKASNKGNVELGDIKWHGPWRKYCYFPRGGVSTLYDNNCLKDIADFLEMITASHKTKGVFSFEEKNDYRVT